MSLSLLLDLDDTLLDSNMSVFIPAYFQKLAGFLSSRVSQDALIKYLMAGTRQMMANTDPRRTLRETFDTEFYPALGLDRNEMQPVLDEFYDEVFPTLQEMTKPRPEAVDFVEWAFTKGYRIAIATNPLFPRKAIYHRLRWAGLSPENYRFDVITSYEDFHFTKPNPAYYAEVLARMGWPDGPILMVGDDPDLDMNPAITMGLPAFWFSTDGSALPDGLKPIAKGNLTSVRELLEKCDIGSLMPNFSVRQGLLAILLSTPAAINGMLSEIPRDLWKQSPQVGEWSLTEILCHLRDVDREVNLPRLETVLTQENPFIPGKETDSWAKDRKYIQQDGRQAQSDFIDTRLELLAQFHAMQEESWMRPIRHAIFGPSNLLELAGFMVEHDRVHVRQIYETIQAPPG